jgi:hypothetical protein
LRKSHNALVHLLSASPDQVRYGVERYQQHATKFQEARAIIAALR